MLASFEWDKEFKALTQQLKAWIVNSSDGMQQIDFDDVELASQLSIRQVYATITSALRLHGRGKKQMLDSRRLSKLKNCLQNGDIHSELKQLCLEWINAAIHCKFHQFDAYIAAMRKGLFFVLPRSLQYLLNAQQFKSMVNGRDNAQYSLSCFSIQQLMSHSVIQSNSPLREKYVLQNKLTKVQQLVLSMEASAIYLEPLNRSYKHIEMFWRVLFHFDLSQIYAFIRFVSGHSQWPLYITSHANPSQMQQQVYSNYIALDSNGEEQTKNKKKKMPISSIHLSADTLYDIECLHHVLRSYHLYGAVMHNNFGNQSIAFMTPDEMNHLWITDECCLTFCNQSTPMSKAVDKFLPEAHTCTCSLRLPHYSTETLLREKLIKAIAWCNTFDSFNNKGNTQFPVNKIISKRNVKFKANIAAKLEQLFK